MKSTFIFDVFGGAHPPRVLVSAPSPDLETQALQIFTEDSEGNEEFCTVPVSSSSFALRFLLFNLIRLSTINYQLLPSTPADCF